MSTRTPIIAIIGRPNVGKSTLFNRVLREKRALVEDIPGVTRDRNYALIERFEIPFYLVDTGGFESAPRDEMAKLVVEQTLLAVQEADLIIALFDSQAGCQPGDEDVASLLRTYNKPIVYAANKCDGVEQATSVADFYQLGLDEVLDLSALHGRGVKQLMSAALQKLPDYQRLLTSHCAVLAREDNACSEVEKGVIEFEDIEGEDAQEFEELKEAAEDDSFGEKEPVFAPVYLPAVEGPSVDEYERKWRLLGLDESKSLGLVNRREDDLAEGDLEQNDLQAANEPPQQIRVAIIGRPNVGKSTLLNTLCGERRALTSSTAGTTRDALDLTLRREGQEYLLIDTAGLRKKARVSDNIEKYSVLRAMNAISSCDVALVILDAIEGPTEQDGKIVGLAHEQGKGIVIAVNKWDAIEKDYQSVTKFKQRVEEAFKFSTYAPILFISAQTGKRCPQIFEKIKEVAIERSKRVSTNQLNRLLLAAAAKQKPSSYRGKPVRLYYATQVDICPPRFVLFFDHPKAVHFSYLRYLKNALREKFGFEGCDIKLVTKKR